MAADLRIGSGRLVGPEWPTLVVAEIGQNHNGRLALAEQLIDAAAWAGADAVKVVKRDLDWELSAHARQRAYPGPHSFGATYGEHRRALELSAEDHAALCDRVRRHGLLYFATASDPPSVDLVAELGADALKIASRDVSNLPLVEYAAQFDRPLVLSTGMSAWDEIDRVVELLDRYATPRILLHCTSLYPTPIADAHLRSMVAMRERYDSLVGYSDHTRGVLLAPVAVALGAVLVEKHLTLDRTMKGTDHACSLEPDELRQLVASVREVELGLGRADKPIPAGVGTVRAKLARSLATRCALPAGAIVDERSLVLKSPGDGIPWAERHRVVGRRLTRDVPADTTLSSTDVE